MVVTLVLLAILAAIFGAVTVAKWLFIVALVFVVAAFFAGRW